MKKTILATIFSLFYLTSVSADIGVNVGLSGAAGLFAMSGHEDLNGSSSLRTKGDEHGEAGFGSVFIEKTLGDRFTIGVDYVPSSLETETTESAKHDKTTNGHR